MEKKSKFFSDLKRVRQKIMNCKKVDITEDLKKTLRKARG